MTYFYAFLFLYSLQKGAVVRKGKMKQTAEPKTVASVNAERSGCMKANQTLKVDDLALNARSVRIGSLRGSPLEPVLLSKDGLHFNIDSM